MMAIIEGVYKQGKIDLLEIPAGLPEGRVRVIVIPEGRPKPPPCNLTFGKYQTGSASTLEDFQDAEWCGEEGLGDRRGQ
jgi:hypothetical protein